VAEEQGGSIGAFRVRESFNPSGDTLVDKIKRYTSDLIDLCEDLKKSDNGDHLVANEQGRCAAIAQTHYEQAAMWAVKAATTKRT
jgi:hypothetical protein